MSDFLKNWLSELDSFHNRKLQYDKKNIVFKLFSNDKISNQMFYSKLDNLFNDEYFKNIKTCNDENILNQIALRYTKLSEYISFEKNFKLLEVLITSSLLNDKIRNQLINFRAALEAQIQSQENINKILSSLK